MHYDMKRIGAVIKHARREQNLTQAALAEKIDVSLRTIIDIENGKRNPTFDVIYSLISVLDIPADLIFRPNEIHSDPTAELFICEFKAASVREQHMAIAISRRAWEEMRRECPKSLSEEYISSVYN